MTIWPQITVIVLMSMSVIRDGYRVAAMTRANKNIYFFTSITLSTMIELAFAWLLGKGGFWAPLGWSP